MVAHLAYKKIQFSLEFDKPIYVLNNTSFVLRSVLGKELRSMCCVMRQNSCSSCMMQYTCIYSWLFESPVKKTDDKPGPDMVSHPFIPEMVGDYQKSSKYTSFIYSILLVGQGIAYLPYIYYALKRAGEHGLYRERIHFSVEDVVCEGQSILISHDSVKNDFGERFISFVSGGGKQADSSYSVFIDFKTPFRFKRMGKYVSDIHAWDLLLACYRRVQGLFGLYADEDSLGNNLISEFDIQDNKSRTFHEMSVLSWREQTYFSSRQKQSMKLGGIVGHMSFSAKLSQFEIQLLEAGSLFHVGKNTSFGLGKFEVKYKIDNLKEE
jgi:CRISPR/Cas system endoribonuclease Cas6 (RAMP superfamily)